MRNSRFNEIGIASVLRRCRHPVEMCEALDVVGALRKVSETFLRRAAYDFRVNLGWISGGHRVGAALVVCL